MLEIKITIESKDIADAVNHLASALSLRSNTTPSPMPAPAAPAPAQAQSPDPTPAPAPTAASAPAIPQQPAATVPLAAPPQYTTDQIMTAGAVLMDAGKAKELTDLLQKYGVQSVMALKKEQLGSFATDLRALGAKL